MFGEVGLAGEVRTVAHVERCLEEATKFGLGDAITATVRRCCARPCGWRSRPAAEGGRVEAA